MEEARGTGTDGPGEADVNRSLQTVIALALGLPAAIVLMVTVNRMVSEHIEMCDRTRKMKARVEVLEAKVQEDAAHVPALEKYLEDYTEATLSRKSRLKDQTAVLAVSAVVFLIGVKWLLSLGGRPAPSLARIQAEQDDSSKKGWRPWRRAAASRNGQPELPDIDLAFVDRVVEEKGRTAEAAIPILQQIQSHYRYLPDEALARVCELTEISPAQVAGVSTFYSQFRRSPVGRYVVKVCHGTACHVAGATEITEEVRRRLKIASDSDTDPDRTFTVDKVACLGCCSLAPVIMIEETTAGKLTPASACQAIETYRVEQSG